MKKIQKVYQHIDMRILKGMLLGAAFLGFGLIGQDPQTAFHINHEITMLSCLL